MTKIKPLKIGNVVLKNNIILAPMAGVTDLPFRLLCAECGAGLVCMEMVSAKAILYNNKNTEELMEIDEREGDVSLQLFGSDERILGDMAKRIEERPFKILDFNMGCPVPKVVGNGEGSALMKDEIKAGRIFESLARSIDKPVTVKIRKGFDAEHVNAARIAHIAEECGISAVIVHGRTREQFYEGKADWDIIKKIKESVSIPVIGNGDVTDGISAEKLLSETGCDGVMIGRAARGNPWIFEEVSAYLSGNEAYRRPSHNERKEVIIRHAGLLLTHKGEYTAVREMRKHLGWYTAGMPNSAAFRRRINTMESFEELKKAVEEIFADS